MSCDAFVVGVDAGGTKTTAWLARVRASEVAVIGRATAGAGNLRAVGAETATKNLLQAITDAFEDATLPRQPVVCLCVGSAGIGYPDTRRRLAQFVAEHLQVAELILVTDAELLLAAAGHHAGVALVAGTGSLAWGRNAFGQTARTGGWGYLLGDEGSAYALGRAALSSVLHAADGSGPPTCLSTLVCQHFRITVPADIVPVVYGACEPRREIASVAPLVFTAVDADDAVAADIEAEGARQLAVCLANVARTLHLTEDFPVVMAGSLLVHQPRYRQLVAAAASDMGPQLGSPQVISEPVAGAIELAAAHARSRR